MTLQTGVTFFRWTQKEKFTVIYWSFFKMQLQWIATRALKLKKMTKKYHKRGPYALCAIIKIQAIILWKSSCHMKVHEKFVIKKLGLKPLKKL